MPKANRFWKPDNRTRKAIARGNRKLAGKIPERRYTQCKYCDALIYWDGVHSKPFTSETHERHICGPREAIARSMANA